MNQGFAMYSRRCPICGSGKKDRLIKLFYFVLSNMLERMIFEEGIRF